MTEICSLWFEKIIKIDDMEIIMSINKTENAMAHVVKVKTFVFV